MREITLLIVDDEPSYLELMNSLLQEEGYKKIITEQYPEKVLNILKENQVDIILLDVYMPKINGLDLLEEINQAHPGIPVIIVTAVDEIDIALRAVKLGAYEFITKPTDVDRLLLSIKRALDQRILEMELNSHRALHSKNTSRKTYFSDIITSSPLMYKVLELVEIFAPTNEMVLITGETGTGKDLIARKIHQLSPRRDYPFVAVNLASITPTLFESELFGHEKGAFTGAEISKKGFFEEANGGTIFLDEIGELPKELQGKLLRTIQYNQISRLGNPKPIQLDIRIIAATNKNLMEAVEEKEFRADLFYRLNRGLIQLPPLRDRGEDVVLLAHYFLKTSSIIYKKEISGFTPAAKNLLKKYKFPGNIRELENLVFNAAAKTKSKKFISELELPYQPEVELDKDNNVKLVSIDEAVKEHIKSVLNYTNYNIQKAAAILGISERTLQRKVKGIREKGMTT